MKCTVRLPAAPAMGLDYAFFRRGPLTMAPSQLGSVHAFGSLSARAPISSSMCSRCRSTNLAIRCTNFPLLLPACAMCSRRVRPCAPAVASTPDHNAGHKPELPPRPTRIAACCRGFDTRGAQDRVAARARRLQAGRIPPRRRRRKRRCGADQGGRRHRGPRSSIPSARPRWAAPPIRLPLSMSDCG